MTEKVTLSEPEQVLAALPHIIGFTPQNSVVVLTLPRRNGVPTAGMAARADLPPDPEHAEALGRYLITGPLQHQPPTEVFLVLIGCGPANSPHRTIASTASTEAAEAVTSLTENNPPYRELAEVLERELTRAGHHVLRSLWTPEIRAGAPWWCYADGHCQGTLPNPDDSPVAAPYAAMGRVTFDSRRELEELISPEPVEILAQRAARIESYLDDLENPASSGKTPPDIRVVTAAIHRLARSQTLTEDDIVQLLVALSDQRIRDMASVTSLGELATAAEQLWLLLTRKAPEPEVADVAALLALSAYVRGDGVLAGVALERVEACRSEHRLGVLLRHALNSGLTPHEVAAFAREAANDAQLEYTEDGPAFAGA